MTASVRRTGLLIGLAALAAGAVVFLNARTIFRSVSAPKLQLSSSSGDVTSFRLQDAKLEPAQIVAISHGLSQALLLSTDGRLYAAGFNDKGQLGVGDREVVVGNLYQVAFPDSVKITAVETDDLHAVALDERGGVWTWGFNISGQIGNGTNKNQSTPFKVMDGAKAVAAGYRMTAAVKQDGTLWVWGMNCDKNNPAYAQLLQEFAANAAAGGYYYGGADVAEQQDCLNEQNLPIASSVPKQVEGAVDVAEAGGGFGHFIWRTNAGEVWTWGCNQYAQLGREKTFNNEGTRIPARVELPEGAKAAKVSAGFRQSAVLDTDGRVWSWGFNQENGTGTNPGTDAVERPALVAIDGRIKDVTAGFDGMVLLTEDGRLQAIGSNAARRFVANETPRIESFQLLADRVALYAFGRETVTFIREQDEK